MIEKSIFIYPTVFGVKNIRGLYCFSFDLSMFLEGNTIYFDLSRFHCIMLLIRFLAFRELRRSYHTLLPKRAERTFYGDKDVNQNY